VLGTANRVGGVWTLDLSSTALAVGPHSIRAEYLGATNFGTSQSAAGPFRFISFHHSPHRETKPGSCGGGMAGI